MTKPPESDNTEEVEAIGFPRGTFYSEKEYARGVRIDRIRILSREPLHTRRPGRGEILTFVVTLIDPNDERFDRVFLARTGGRPSAVGIDSLRVEAVADALDAYLAEREAA